MDLLSYPSKYQNGHLDIKAYKGMGGCITDYYIESRVLRIPTEGDIIFRIICLNVTASNI